MKLFNEGLCFKTKVREIDGRYAIKIPERLIKKHSLKDGDKLQQFLVKSNDKIIGWLVFLDKKGLSKKFVRGKNHEV